MVDRYRWNGSELERVERRLDPSPWLIHTIYAALDAHATGDYEGAVARLGAALTDEGLQLWNGYAGWRPELAGEGRERRELRAFARFRIALAELARTPPAFEAAG